MSFNSKGFLAVSVFQMPVNSKIPIDFCEFDMINFDALVLITIYTVFKGSSKLFVGILFHGVIMILFILPSQEREKRKPIKKMLTTYAGKERTDFRRNS